MTCQTFSLGDVMNLIERHVMLFDEDKIFFCVKAIVDWYEIKWMSVNNFHIKELTHVIIKNQLLALGLMTETKSEDKGVYYALTPYGELYVRQCWAIRKLSPVSEQARPPSSLPGEVEA
jgi:hypothetical protein